MTRSLNNILQYTAQKSILVLAVLLLPTPGISQSKNPLLFDTMVHDFGVFGEDDDSPSFKFKFKNTGKQPVAISHVSTTCGCAVAEYTRLPIMPDKEGIIEVTYNPKGHPGKFNRSITAFISGNDRPIQLTIKGIVGPGSKRKHAGYSYVMGGLQLKNNTISVTHLPGVKKTSTVILVINSSDEPLDIALEPTSSAFVGEAHPKTLLPDEKGELEITCFTDNPFREDEKVYVILNGKKESKNHIKIEKGRN